MTGCSGNVRPRVLSAAATLLCGVLVAAPAIAETLNGIVKDPSGQVVVGVTVVVENKATLQRIEASTSTYGQYSVKRLRPGDYRIIVKSGSLEGTKNVTVRPGEIAPGDIELRVVVTDSTTVTTLEAPTALALPDGAMGTLLSRPFLDGLPGVNGRTLQSVITLAPNAAVTETNATQAQVTANGQRRFSNRTTIDLIAADFGVNVNNSGLHQAESGALPALAASGGTQTLVPMAAVDEIQIRTTNASVEYSRTPGAQTVIVTRAGSNQFTASGFTEARPRGLSATDWFDNREHKPKRTGDYWDSGVTLGGPILPRKLFYFGTWQRQQINRNVVGTNRVPSLATREGAPDAVRPLLDAYPMPNGADLTGDDEGLAELHYRYPIVSALNALSVRVDATPSDVHRLFTRVNRGRSSGDSLGFDLLPSMSTSFAEATSTTTVTMGLTSTWSMVAHELRVNTSTHSASTTANPFAYGNPDSLPLSMLVPATATDTYVQVNLFPGPGGNIAFGQLDQGRHHQFQFVDTWSVAAGRHDWRFGVDFRQATIEKDPAAVQVFYRFAGLGDLFSQPPRVRNVAIDEYQPTRTRRLALSMFVQDTLRISPRLSLHAGLRYGVKPAPEGRTETQPTLVTFETLPEVAYELRGARLWNTSWTDFGPSVSAIYRLGSTDGRETILRTGWSVVFDELTSPGVSAFVNGYPFIDSRALPISAFPVPLANLDGGGPRALNYYSFPRDFRTPRTYDWQIALEHSRRGNRFGLAYVGTAGRDLSHWYAIDIDGARIQTYSNEGTSDYHAMVVEYVRRLSKGLQGRVAYTWGHAIDTDSGEATSPPLPPDVSPVAANRASADYDRRQLFHATASYSLPTPRIPDPFRFLLKDWQIDAMVVVVTGAPVTATIRRIPGTNGFEYRPDLVPGVPIWISDSTSPTGRRLNSEAFEVPAEFRQGTLGRNTLRSSSLRQLNLGVARSIRLRGRMKAEVRVDAFNVLNVPNFGPPINTTNDELFGVPTRSYAEALGTGTLSRGGLVPLHQHGGPRSVQLGLRLAY